MGDPELVARAHRAAERLERSWDRWRRLHGLAAEQAQPVSSYVGYSLAEPWGRPRVVFGMAAQEAERLAARLEWDMDADPRSGQGLLWEQGPQGLAAEAGGHAVEHSLEHPVEHGANGGQPVAAAIPEARPAEPRPELPGPAAGWTPGGVYRPAPPAGATEPGVPQGIGADLAGWTSGELPGQASAGLAAQEKPGHPADAGPAAPDPAAPDPAVPAPTAPDPAVPAPTVPAPTVPDPAAWLRLA